MIIHVDLLIASILIVSMCVLLELLYIDTEMVSTPMISYEKMKRIANTGDLIIFRWVTIDIGFRLFSKFSHVGMIVKHKNQLYLLETHPKENLDTDIDDSGIHLYHLKKRLEEYNGTYYFSQLNTKNALREHIKKHVLQNLKKYKQTIPFDTNFRNVFVLNYVYNLLGIPLHKKKSMFCSEFIGTILDKCNVYKHYKNLASLNPGTFLDLKKKDGTSLYGIIYNILIS